jgi:superfamily II DNA or RNA helicase
MKIIKSDIVRAIGNIAYFERGVSYFSGRKVLSIELGGSDQISGVVAGSGGRIYSVDIAVSEASDGRIENIDGYCSCPIGYNCKHVVAVMLEAAQKVIDITPEPATFKAPSHAKPNVQARLPGPVSAWLDRFNAPDGPEIIQTRSKPSNSNEMFYVFRRSFQGRAEIVPFKAYVKKDGTIGKNVQEYSGRHGLSHAPAGTSLEDAVIFAQLGYLSSLSYPPQYDWPDGEELAQFLQQVVGTGRARAEDVRGPLLKWAEPRKVAFQWQLDDQGNQTLGVSDDNGRALVLLPFPTPVFIDKTTDSIGFAETDLSPHVANALAIAPPVPAEAVDAVTAILAEHGEQVPKPNPVEIQERTDVKLSAGLKLFGHRRRERDYSRGWGGRTSPEHTVVYPCIRAYVLYEGHDQLLEPGKGTDIRIAGAEGLSVIRRDVEEELRLLQQLDFTAEEFEGFAPELADIYGRIPKAMEEAHIVFPPVYEDEKEDTTPALGFMAEGLPELKKLGWVVEIDKSWPIHLHSGSVSFQTNLVSADNDWFSLGLQLDVDGVTLDVTPTILQIIASLPLGDDGALPEGFDLKKFLEDIVLYQRLPDGTLVPIPGAKLAGFVEAFLEMQGLTRFHQAEAGRLKDLVEALDGCGAPWKGGREILELGERLRSLDATKEEGKPASLKADLRPYQRVGYGWLRALSESGFGGILADDMGLGKTVQTLALLAHRHLERKSDRPSLLVIPTSLISNWQNEVARFTPDLKLLTLHGTNRGKRFDDISDHDLVMTTYPLVNRDHEALFAHEFDLAILDEAQAVKNPAASVAKRIRQIKARQRIALTGTPLENNLTELWALFDWLIPGLLGDRKGFGAEYRRPIEQKGDRAQQRLLSTRLKPFLLRRTKDEVAGDLPPKTVVDEMVTLSGKQGALYESVRGAMDARVRDAVAAKGLAGSRITVLDALLKLRQVCCDPRLVKLDAAKKVKESAKLDRLMEILDELMSEGRKVLVFSQFVEMLRLIENEIHTRAWPYAILHGQTKDRTSQIDRFQTGDAKLFLISLKAGGTGLNLTAADTVILYDPWWNPAVERQAMDRAHRIGQDKPVFVYRLYSANTVETAIQSMQAQKQALADALFEGTSGGPMALTEDDLTALFGAG